ncbi:hypothetical protein [Cellulomonas carbonis]|nr:hypothetical protein [Cellulomonas carbonis]
MPEDVSSLPEVVGRPAARALEAAGYHAPADLDGASEKTLLALHGVGPRAIRALREQGVELVP